MDHDPWPAPSQLPCPFQQVPLTPDLHTQWPCSPSLCANCGPSDHTLYTKPGTGRCSILEEQWVASNPGTQTL